MFLSTVAYVESNAAKVETEATVPVDSEVAVPRATRPQGRSERFRFMVLFIAYITTYI